MDNYFILLLSKTLDVMMECNSSTKSENSNLEKGKKSVKVHKKVSFDTKPRHLNFARKSTSSHQKMYGGRATTKKCVLKLTKVDISGYKLPGNNDHETESESDSSFGCARLIQANEVLFCARTCAVKRKSTNSSLNTSTDNGSIMTTLLDVSSQEKGLASVKKEAMKKIGEVLLGTKVTKQRREKTSSAAKKKKKKKKSKTSYQGGAHVKYRSELGACSKRDDDMGDGFPEFFKQDGTSSGEIEYEQRLKDTIKKMTGEVTNTKKKR